MHHKTNKKCSSEGRQKLLVTELEMSLTCQNTKELYTSLLKCTTNELLKHLKTNPILSVPYHFIHAEHPQCKPTLTRKYGTVMKKVRLTALQCAFM